jgi:dephospho-CoA kinase
MSFLLGLTGSIGSGKTTLAKIFADCGIPVWNADHAVAEIYRSPPTVLQDFLISIDAIDPQTGWVDRPKLRALILDDPDILTRLETHIHPLTEKMRGAFIDTHSSSALLVFEIPLLYEKGLQNQFDAIVTTRINRDERRRRVLARPGITPALFDALDAKQIPCEDKIKKSDFVIDTKNLHQTRLDVETLIAHLLQKK